MGRKEASADGDSIVDQASLVQHEPSCIAKTIKRTESRVERGEAPFCPDSQVPGVKGTFATLLAYWI
jgi:hypothetical protein